MRGWPGLKAARVQPNTGRAQELLAATKEMMRVFKHCYFCHCVSVNLMVLPDWVLWACALLWSGWMQAFHEQNVRCTDFEKKFSLCIALKIYLYFWKWAGAAL